MTAAVAWGPARQDRRAARVTLAAVLLLHLAVGLLWWLHRPAWPIHVEAPVVSWLQLVPDTPRAPPPAMPIQQHPPTKPRAPIAAPRPALVLPVAPRAAPTAIHDPGVTVAAPPAASAPDATPLNLALPSRPASAPRSMLDQMLNDPRVHTTESASERFARNLGTDETEHVDRMADGRRVRKGSHCYIVRDSRAAQLDPFNGALDHAPKLVGNC